MMATLQLSVTNEIATLSQVSFVSHEVPWVGMGLGAVADHR